MEGLGSVQQKVSCVFETTVLNEQSSKRDNQAYKVTHIVHVVTEV